MISLNLFESSKQQYSIIGIDDGFGLTRQKAIIWTIDG